MGETSFGEKPLVVVAGPTASGKTRLAIDICRRFGGEVISADSMQLYRGMEIATAAPTPEELRAARHHLVGILSPGEEFSVADWAGEARKIIARLHDAGILPVVAGGTGLYISSLLDQIDYTVFSGDGALRAQLWQEAREQGPQALYDQLKALDPELCLRLHPNNMGRVIRALEVTRATGVPMSVHQRRARERAPGYRVCALALGFCDRTKMWERIDARVDRMLKAGLVEEARRFYAGAPAKTAAAAIGYKELLPFLRGEMPLEEAAAHLKLRTRQYAKRQLTWLRRDARFQWLEADRHAPQELAQEAGGIIERALRTSL